MTNYFKKFTLLLVVAFGFLLSACSEEDANSLAIVGVYTLSQETVSGCNDTADNVSENKTCSALDCETLVINGNNTFSITDINNGVTSSINGTYSLNGSEITFMYVENNVNETDVATYSLNGSTLTLNFAAEDNGCFESETYSKN